MPHRPIGSHWRFTGHHAEIRLGDIAVVLANQGRDANLIRIQRTGLEFTRSLLNGVWEPVVAVEDGNNQVAAPVPPPVAPVRFEPAQNEMYIVVYRHTRESAQRQYGADAVTSSQNRFGLLHSNSPTTALGTIQQARDAIQRAMTRDYDAYIIPLRAIEHWHNGNRQEIGVEVIQAQAVPADPDDDEYDAF